MGSQEGVERRRVRRVCAGAGAAECLLLLLPHWKVSQLWPLCSGNAALERLESAVGLALASGGSGGLSCDGAALPPQQARSVSAALTLLQRLTFLSPEAFSVVTGAGMLRCAQMRPIG